MNRGSGSYVGMTRKNMAAHTLKPTVFSLKIVIMCVYACYLNRPVRTPYTLCADNKCVPIVLF